MKKKCLVNINWKTILEIKKLFGKFILRARFEKIKKLFDYILFLNFFMIFLIQIKENRYIFPNTVQIKSKSIILKKNYHGKFCKP